MNYNSVIINNIATVKMNTDMTFYVQQIWINNNSKLSGRFFLPAIFSSDFYTIYSSAKWLKDEKYCKSSSLCY